MTLVCLAVAFLGGKGLASIYAPPVPAAVNLAVAGTPEQLARGEYLVNLSCVGCHGAIDSNGNPSGVQPLTGGWNIAAAEGFGFVGDMVTENLTPGGKLASYSDGELFRTLRHGVDQDGNRLGFMALLPYAQLSDTDTEAIIAYLRSLPAETTNVPTGDRFSYLGMIMYGAGIFGEVAPGAETVTVAPEGETVEYGKYVATYAECRGCHGPDAEGAPGVMGSPPIPNPRPLVTTLTLEQFAEMMKTGVRPNGIPFPETMPWEVASRLTEGDMAALYLYLTAPVE
jgi:cytochrome c553